MTYVSTSPKMCHHLKHVAIIQTCCVKQEGVHDPTGNKTFDEKYNVLIKLQFNKQRVRLKMSNEYYPGGFWVCLVIHWVSISGKLGASTKGSVFADHFVLNFTEHKKKNNIELFLAC